MYTIAPPKNHKAPKLPKRNVFWRYVLYAFLTFLLLTLLAFGAFFFYLKQHPHDLSQSISSELYAKTGMKLVFSSIDVAVLPLPALSFANVELKGKEFTLDVAYATVTPSLISLIKGEFSFGKISLWRPILNWNQKKSLPTPSQTDLAKDSNLAETQPKKNAQSFEDLGKLIQDNFHSLGDSIPSFFRNSSLQVLHGNFSLQNDEFLLQSENINANLKLGLLNALDAEIIFKNVHILSDAQLMADLGNLTLELSGNVGKNVGIKVSSFVTIPKALQEGNFSFAMDYEKNSTKKIQQNTKPATHDNTTNMMGSWNFDAKLLWMGAQIPLKSSGNFSGNIHNTIHLENIIAVLDQDSVRARANLNIRDITNPILRGRLDIEDFSLTQWFGFARQLPLGLRHALDNINGELDFVMDKHGLDVPRLAAIATGANFNGKGSVKSWINPVIFLEASTNELMLKNILPELEGLPVSELHFSHEPLTPIPGAEPTDDAEEDSTFELNYDINIHAKKLLAFAMPLNGMHFRCLPTPLESKLKAEGGKEKAKELSSKHSDAVTLSFSVDKFYGGRGDARAVLYNSLKQASEKEQESSSETIYEIVARLQNVAALTPITRIIGKNLVDGKLSLNANITTKGKYISEILMSKRGTVALKIQKGNFYTGSGKKTPFKTLTLQGDFNAKKTSKIQENGIPSKLQYAGKWQANLDMPDVLAKGAWNGTLEFLGKNLSTVQLSNFAGSLNTRLSAKLTSLPRLLESTVQGNFSLNTTTSIIEVRNAKANIKDFADLNLAGKATINYANNIQWSADGKAETSSINRLLKRINKQGKSFLPPSMSQTANVHFSAKYAKDRLHLENLTLAADDINASGNLTCQLADIPHWKFDLHFNTFDYDKYFPKKSSLGYTHVRGLGAEGVPVYTDGQEIKSDGMSWQWLKDLRVDGVLKVGMLRISKMQFRNISTDVSIDNATLQLKALTGTLYGGTMDANFWGALRDNTLQTRINLDIKGTELFDLTKDLQLGTAFSGKSSLSLALTGELGRKNVLAGFNGKWKLHIGKGFMQPITHDGKLTGSPTKIDSFSDNGLLSAGILNSQNLKLFGPDMKIIGKGNINFINNTLDMRLNADLGYIVDIPVRFHGDLKDPERTLNAGAVVIAALGTLGTGVFDLLGGIFGTIFGVF